MSGRWQYGVPARPQWLSSGLGRIVRYDPCQADKKKPESRDSGFSYAQGRRGLGGFIEV